jgi:hypothetical protein
MFNSQLVLTHQSIALFLEDSIYKPITIEGVDVWPLSKL